MRPIPFATLARRALQEARRIGHGGGEAIFELPARKIWSGRAGLDLAVVHHGQRAANPLGPAAGPHTQLAQNLVVGWLAGCRIFEFKTVQVRDDLQIARPCIDMATVGFNVEWSQELPLAQSAREYVKGALLIEVLRRSQWLPVPPDAGEVIFDMSVGYDLAGVQSAGVQQFLATMADCRREADRLRTELPREFRHLGDVPLPKTLSRSLTLSTFHGCPPGEIEAIAVYLLAEKQLDVTVKLNPTLLGHQRVCEILRGELGYDDIRVPKDAFDADATWPQVTAMVGRLRDLAKSLGRGFGVKFCNTLVVENHKTFFPASEPRMYLSGPPLHVLAMELVAQARQQWPSDVPLSFSAGIDRQNFADAVALGMVPVTACSDLLQPGGYARACGYLEELCARMKAVGAQSIGDFVLRARGNAEKALIKAGHAKESGSWPSLQRALKYGDDLHGVLATAEKFDRWMQAGAALNTAEYAATCPKNPRYAAAKHRKPPRKLARDLRLFDCTNCDKCLAVCPNTAVFSVATDDHAVCSAGAQIAIFADACNDCGNCEVFCPDSGAPNRAKPRLYADRAAFESAAPRDGIWMAIDASEAIGRFEGRVARSSDQSPDGEALRAIAAAVADPRRCNYLNSAKEPAP